MAVHRLKTWPAPFEAVRLAAKPFEYRSEDDRSFEVGDLLCLEEYDNELERYTGNALWRLVTFVLRGAFGVPDGYAVLGLNYVANAELFAVDLDPSDILQMGRIERAAAGAAR